MQLKHLHSLYSDEVNNTLHKHICDMNDVLHNGTVDTTQQQDGAQLTSFDDVPYAP